MRIAFAALSLALAPHAGNAIQLTPAGTFRARDGRPKDLAGWKMDASIAAKLIEQAAARATPYVIDYEHQTLATADNGKPAPAAGWFKTLEWRDGQGLFATDVQWTDAAKAMIDAGEYKFISPVFGFDRATGAVLKLQMAALTNTPALDGMDAVAALAQEFFTRSQEPTHEKDQPMKALALLLGLKEDATEAEINAAIVALNAKVAAHDATVAALKEQAGKPDPAKFVPVESVAALQADLAALTARLNEGELEDVVQAALKEGKLLPAMEPWARELGKKDLAALKGYVEKFPAVLNGNQTGGRAPAGEQAGDLSVEQLAVCKLMGVKVDDFKATLKAAA